MKTAREIGARNLVICSNSQLMISQVKGEYQAKEPTLQKYLRKVKEACLDFIKVEFTHVPREQNIRADILSRLASKKNLAIIEQ